MTIIQVQLLDIWLRMLPSLLEVATSLKPIYLYRHIEQGFLVWNCITKLVLDFTNVKLWMRKLLVSRQQILWLLQHPVQDSWTQCLCTCWITHLKLIIHQLMLRSNIITTADTIIFVIGTKFLSSGSTTSFEKVLFCLGYLNQVLENHILKSSMLIIDIS